MIHVAEVTTFAPPYADAKPSVAFPGRGTQRPVSRCASVHVALLLHSALWDAAAAGGVFERGVLGVKMIFSFSLFI